jgi:hypothetical protein
VTVNSIVVPLPIPLMTVPVLPGCILMEDIMSLATQFVTLTVNPVAVDTGVSNVGTTPARSDIPVTVAAPDVWPVLVVATLTVDDTPAATPVIVNGREVPLGVPAVTVPVLSGAIDGVKLYAEL